MMATETPEWVKHSSKECVGFGSVWCQPNQAKTKLKKAETNGGFVPVQTENPAHRQLNGNTTARRQGLLGEDFGGRSSRTAYYEVIALLWPA